MIWLVLHHFLTLNETFGVVFDDEAFKTLVVTPCFLLWSLVICLKFVEGNASATIKQS